MNARVAGERCALRRVMKANVSTTGGSKPTLCSRRANPRPSPMRRVPTVSPRPARGQVERRLDVLDLDDGLERHPRALGALGELAPRRVRPAEARVVEDQRSLREALDRHRLEHVVGIGREVEQLVGDRGLDVEAAVVDRQHDQPGLELPVADGVGDLRGVLADQAHAHVGVAGAEVLHEVGEQVVGRVAEGAEGRRPRRQLAHLADGVARRPARRPACAPRAAGTGAPPRSARGRGDRG